MKMKRFHQLVSESASTRIPKFSEIAAKLAFALDALKSQGLQLAKRAAMMVKAGELPGTSPFDGTAFAKGFEPWSSKRMGEDNRAFIAVLYLVRAGVAGDAARSQLFPSEPARIADALPAWYAMSAGDRESVIHAAIDGFAKSAYVVDVPGEQRIKSFIDSGVFAKAKKYEPRKPKED